MCVSEKLAPSIQNERRCNGRQRKCSFSSHSVSEIRSDGSAITIVDFYADWCGPCQAYAPTLESLAQELKGKAQFVKINIDDARAEARAYSIRSIPTLVFLRDGKEIARATGALPRSQLAHEIQRLLKVGSLESDHHACCV
jgi:thioredoxin